MGECLLCLALEKISLYYNFMRLSKLFLVIAIISLGYYTGTVAPYHLSPQKSLDLTSLTGEYDATSTQGSYLGKPVMSQLVQPPVQISNVLGENTSNKRI